MSISPEFAKIVSEWVGPAKASFSLKAKRIVKEDELGCLVTRENNISGSEERFS
jgi:hypothetical protein